MTFESWFTALHAAIPIKSADAVLRLVSEGATIPFIARYRKEQTGNIDEVAIQNVIESHERWEKILQRQKHIVEEIDRQKKLTPELKERVLSTFQLELLEDIYLPYKQKRKTKAAAAREAGLEPLAEWIWACGHGTETPLEGQTLELWAFTFRNDDKEIKDADSAIAGAQDILIERLSETQELRQLVRTRTFETGVVRTGKADKAKPHSKYENYFSYNEVISSLLQPQNSHRYLALRRGWMEEELSLNIGGKPDTEGGDGGFEAELLQAFESAACTCPDSPGAAVLLKAARLALKAHVLPSIENEAHKALKDIADTAAIRVFAENVRKLLMASPFGPKAVLGVDPGIRTGCKVAVVDDSGKYLGSTVIHLKTEEQKKNAKTLIGEAVKNGSIRAIAVGNGTAGRETESFIRGVLTELKAELGSEGAPVPVVMVNEAGASVYSASEAARDEFPELDVTVRGAISIARRLQDPLAELVKIDPKSIGVGQYQHDVSEPALRRSLELVVDTCVNQVGVNLNTASYHLLSHVAGIGPSLAKAIVEHRGQKGLFRSREALHEVPRFSAKVFEQSAGFLRVPESENPLDNTGVHPERYGLLEKRAAALGRPLQELMGAGTELLRKDSEFKGEVGEFTFHDIVRELEKPGRDPRDAFVAFQFREDIHELKDLVSGMICPGIVTNVTNFGAFVDIGVHQDGLVHLSQLANHYVKDPNEVVSPGDRVQVKVLEINLEKNQISLTMRVATEARRPPSEGRERSRPRDRERSPAQSPRHANSASSARPARPTPSGRPSPVASVGSPGPMAKSAQGNHPSAPGPSPVKPAQPRRPLAPKQVFNNAFAGLADLRNQLKPKGK